MSSGEIRFALPYVGGSGEYPVMPLTFQLVLILLFMII